MLVGNLDESKLSEIRAQILIWKWVQAAQVVFILNAFLKIVRQRRKLIGRDAEKDHDATLPNYKAGGCDVQQRYCPVYCSPFHVTMLEDVAVSDHGPERLLDSAS